MSVNDVRAAQALAEPAYRAQQLSAPPHLIGEDLASYRRRLLMPLVQHSPTWHKVDVNALPQTALGIAEQQVYADSIAVGTRNSGPLKEVIETDRTGRQISRFFGSPSACWDMFKQPTRHVVGWNTKP